MTDKQKLDGSQIAGDSGHKRAWELGEKKEGDEEILFYLLFASRAHSDDVMAGLTPVRRDGGSDLMRSTVVAVCSWLILLVGDGELHGFCSLASRAVIGGSDPCVLPATTGGGSGLVSVRRQGMQEDGRP